jgi:hypothetical protein
MHVVLLVIAAGAAIVFVLAGLFGLVQNRWLNTIHDDSELYLAVGNGMRHGLTPWVDLFETKPPVVFWFSRIFLALDPSRMNAGSFTLPLVLVLVAAPVLVVWRRLRGQRASRTTVVATMIVVGVSALWIFAGQLLTAGLFESETFGASFTVAALVASMMERRKVGWPIAIGCGAFAVLSKETFAPIVFSLAAWIAWEQTGSLRRAIARTAIFAGAVLAAAVGLLAITGLLGPYVGVYLPWMAELRVHDFWSRFAAAVGWRPVWRYLHVISPYAAELPVLWLALLAAAPRRWSRVVPALACLSVTFAMIGFGGEYWPQHFGHLFPWCVVVLWLIPWVRLDRWVLAGAAVLSIAFTVDMTRQSTRWPRGGPDLWVMSRLAYNIDEIAQACHFSTYPYIGLAQRAAYGFTDTPPLGPLFFQFPEFLNGPGAEHYFAQLMTQVERAPFVVYHRLDSPDAARLHAKLEHDFTRTPPACAAPIIADMPIKYELWFRR